MIDPSMLVDQAALAYFSSHALQMLKASKYFPIMQVDAKKLNMAFSAFVAFIVSVGIHMTMETHAIGAGHMLAIQIAIPDTAATLHGIKNWLVQCFFQDASFKAFIQGRTNGNQDSKLP